MILKVRSKIAKEQVQQFLEKMNKLGFEETEF